MMNYHPSVEFKVEIQAVEARMGMVTQSVALGNIKKGQMTMKIQNTISRFIDRQTARMKRDRTRVAALHSAFTIISRRHRMWVESGFDMHFLQNQAAPLLEPFLQGGEAPDAQTLAAAWCGLYHFTGERQQKAQESVLPVAADFVYVLQSELACLAPVQAKTTHVAPTIAVTN